MFWKKTLGWRLNISLWGVLLFIYREIIRNSVNADKNEYSVLFVGSGSKYLLLKKIVLNDNSFYLIYLKFNWYLCNTQINWIAKFEQATGTNVFNSKFYDW